MYHLAPSPAELNSMVIKIQNDNPQEMRERAEAGIPAPVALVWLTCPSGRGRLDIPWDPRAHP